MLENPQRTPAARMLESRLQRDHLAHAERETLGYRKVRLRLAQCAVAGLENSGELVPAFRWGCLDERGDGAIEKERKEEGRRHGLVVDDPRIGVPQPLQQ